MDGRERADLPNELPASESDASLAGPTPGEQNELPRPKRGEPALERERTERRSPLPADPSPGGDPVLPKARLRRERSEGKRGRQGEGGGPKTKAGKARSSRNSTKHGIRSPHPFIIEGLESSEEWEEFKLGIIESWQPVGMQELEHAINIAFDHWKLRRCRLYENALLSKQVEETEYELQLEDADGDGLPEGAPLPAIEPERLVHHQCLELIPDGWSIDRILRYEAQVRKTLSQDTHMLEVQQAHRRGERTPLARVEFNSGPSYARRTSNANEIPDLQFARQRVRLAEIALADRRLAARTEKAGRGS